MTTGQDLVIGGLLNINAYSPGQPLSASVGAQALAILNDLLDSLSTDQDFVFTQTENIIAWTPGQYKYTIGNPVGGTFTGTVTSGSPTITGVTVPSALVAGGDLTDFAALIPANTTVLSFNSGAGTVTMSANAISNYTGDVITYTTPGNIKLARPLRIRSGYTRITASGNTGLDYWFDCQNSMNAYNQIGFKGVAGPWPTQLAYQPNYPLGTLWIYPNPQQAGEVHLFTDIILSNLALTTTVNLPQGYSRALKKLLGLELCPMFGKTPSPELRMQAKEARDLLKAQNASPIQTLRYDSAISRSQVNDAGWIMSGGLS